MIALLGSAIVGVAAGCGSSSTPASPPLGYRPPLRVSPRALAPAPGSALAARKKLRGMIRTLKPPLARRDRAVHFGYAVFRVILVNPGSPAGFALSQTLDDEFRVMPDSSATIDERVLTSPRFVSNADRRKWESTGKRPYASTANHAGASRREELPRGGWSFTPQGRKLTFARVRHLPAARSPLTQELAHLLGAHGQLQPPAALSLQQYAFLLATAPVTRAVRVTLLNSMSSLPGIYLCGGVFPAHDPHYEALCVNGHPLSTEILLNSHTGVVALVCQRLDDRTPLFPNLTIGSLIDSYTFSRLRGS